MTTREDTSMTTTRKVVAGLIVLGVAALGITFANDTAFRAAQADDIRNDSTEMSPCFEITGAGNPAGSGSSFLLNKCTGEAW